MITLKVCFFIALIACALCTYDEDRWREGQQDDDGVTIVKVVRKNRRPPPPESKPQIIIIQQPQKEEEEEEKKQFPPKFEEKKRPVRPLPSKKDEDGGRHPKFRRGFLNTDVSTRDIYGTPV
jgi:hypothetical protein